MPAAYSALDREQLRILTGGLQRDRIDARAIVAIEVAAALIPVRLAVAFLKVLYLLRDFFL